jgi:hypothetical protein
MDIIAESQASIVNEKQTKKKKKKLTKGWMVNGERLHTGRQRKLAPSGHHQ